MIDRQHDKILIECDSCDQVYEGEVGEEFTTVWSAAKRDGWSTRKIADEWLHGCPRCGAPS
jgi:rubredoxin